MMCFNVSRLLTGVFCFFKQKTADEMRISDWISDVCASDLLTARDLLVWTNRQTDGDGYDRLRSAFERLSGTRITTNIKADGEEITEGFGLINEWRIVRQTRSGQMSEIKVTLSDWLFKMVEGRSVLTLHRDYFRLCKPLERRIYEL